MKRISKITLILMAAASMTACGKVGERSSLPIPQQPAATVTEAATGTSAEESTTAADTTTTAAAQQQSAQTSSSSDNYGPAPVQYDIPGLTYINGVPVVTLQ